MSKSIAIFITFSIILVGAIHQIEASSQVGSSVYLPLIITSMDGCATTSSHSYMSGTVSQHDTDNPVRLAYNHADKNITLRGYTINGDGGLQKELIDYGSDDPTQPPQFATFFDPYQVPAFSEFYQVHQWSWAASPEPGTAADAITVPKVTAISFSLAAYTPLHTPTSGYDIGGGMEVIVLYADEDTIALHYTREDSAALGYTIHIDQICTDPNLLALYNALDNADGARYDYPSASYDLPTLAEGETFGTTSENDMVIMIADTGSYQDPRSCNEWWQIRPDYTGLCPTAADFGRLISP